jgi:hypothetical protein
VNALYAGSSANIRLVETGSNANFESLTLCDGGAVGGDDTEILESGIVYYPLTFTTSFDVPGPLSAPNYTLVLCHDLVSEDALLLDGNGGMTEEIPNP